MIKKFLLPLFAIATLNVLGQDKPFRYEKDFLPASFHKANRESLRSQLPDSSFAILFSAPVRNRANDTDYPYHQNPNFYYLTGYTEPNSILLIFKNKFAINGVQSDEWLFISPRNKSRETWTGRMPSIEDARIMTGIETILLNPSFDSLDIDQTDFKKILYLTLPAGLVNDRRDSCDLFELVEIFKQKFNYPPDNGDSFLLGKILGQMREVKKPEEMKLLKKAILISCSGHIEMMKSFQVGMTEYQVQAEGEFIFRKLGAESVGYNSICGAGENSCYMHYEKNRKDLKSGELILLDMGAEYHGYTADVTRTLPVGGKFSNEQKIIYDLVYKAQDSAFSQCKPGSEFLGPHQAAVAVIRKGLLDLGIIKNEEDYRKYFMHGTSHYLGLDVHDTGTRGYLKAGNVITVEPGIYIPENSDCDRKWWKIGVRIEDDILITESGYENLSASCPSTSEDVEKMMQKATISK